MLKLRTQRLSLIAFDAERAALQIEDVPAFCNALGAGPVSAWPPAPFDSEGLEWACASLRIDREGEGWYGWVLLEDGHEGAQRHIVGAAALVGRPDEDGEVELGFGLLPEHRGRGLAGEAIQALVDWALTNGARQVVVHCDAEDDLSLKTLARSGFQETKAQPYPGVARWAMAAA